MICRSAVPQKDDTINDFLVGDGWSRLYVEQDLDAQWVRTTSRAKSVNEDDTLRDWYWKEVAEVQIPSRLDEKQRIENANGRFTVEHEVLYVQMQRMDFCDEDVIEIFRTRHAISAIRSSTQGTQHFNLASFVEISPSPEQLVPAISKKSTEESILCPNTLMVEMSTLFEVS